VNDVGRIDEIARAPAGSVIDDAPATVDENRAAELPAVAHRAPRNVPGGELAQRLGRGAWAEKPRPPKLGVPEGGARRVGDHGQPGPGEAQLAHEGSEGIGMVVTDQDQRHPEALQLGQPGHDPVNLTGPVHSAEVTQEYDQGRSVQEVAEPADAVHAVYRGVAQLRGDRLAEPHATQRTPAGPAQTAPSTVRERVLTVDVEYRGGSAHAHQHHACLHAPRRSR
jgi:hypothetical protein